MAVTGWLSRIFKRTRRYDPAPALPVTPRDEDAELAELAALIESGDTSEAALDRVAKLLGQSDPREGKV